MAQVIITKNGTGSAEPSSLVQGELGLNVSTGQLFYGTSGSSNAVSSSFVFTNVTASNISASGIIKTKGIEVGSSRITFVGSNNSIFPGNPGELNFAGSDINVFTGQVELESHLTASGNVDFNGNLDVDGITNLDVVDIDGAVTIANNTKIQGENTGGDVKDIAYISTGNRLFLGGTSLGTTIQSAAANMFLDSAGDITIDSDSGNVYFKDNTATSITFNTEDGHITASGDISASGTITGNTLRLSSTTDASATSTGHAFQSGLTTDANIIINSNEIMARNNGAVAPLYLNPDGGMVAFQNSEANSVQIDHGHITASGDISASGTIVANKIEADVLVSHANDANTGLEFGSDTVSIEGNNLTIATFASNRVEINKAVTCSNNISASTLDIATNIKVNNMPAGVDNSVVILDSDNVLKTDEVQSVIFGSDPIITAATANEQLAGVELPEVTVGAASIATQAKTIRTTTNAGFFPVMVDSTNASATAETLVTPTAGFEFNPSTKTATIGFVSATNITASQNISASGTYGIQTTRITASGNINTTGIIQVEGVNAIDYISSTHLFGANSSFTKLRSTVGIEMTAPVTASGPVSSSEGFIGEQHILRCLPFYVNDSPFIQNSLYFGSTAGHQPSNWNDPQAIGGDPNTVTSFDIGDDDQNWGMCLPFDISRIEIQSAARPGLGAGENFTAALYTASRVEGNETTITLGFVTASQTTFDGGGKYTNLDIDYRPDTVIPKGTMLYFGVGTTTSGPTAKNARGYHTILVTKASVS